MKDLQTHKTLLRSESFGDLYPILTIQNNTSTSTALLASTPKLWHKRLGHLNNAALSSIFSNISNMSNVSDLPLFCEPCHLEKNNKLPFQKSQSLVKALFDIVHSDMWISPIQNISGIRFYFLFLDHFTHFLWVYPLQHKSDVFSKFLHFTYLFKTQFNTQIKLFQCDNGGEFQNRDFQNFFDIHGIVSRFSCPHTSQ